MNIALWITAAVLATACVGGGTMKLFLPMEKLATTGSEWVEDFSPQVVRSIGTLELLAAAGLVLPALLDVAPVMVPVAATGLMLLMVCAAFAHRRRHEVQRIMFNMFVLVVAGFVVWGRFGPHSF